MDYSQQSKISHQSSNSTYNQYKMPVSYFNHQFAPATPSNHIQQSGIQNEFREQQLLSHPFFTWEQAGVGQVPPLLDAYGNTATSLHPFHESHRSNVVENVYNPSTPYSTEHSHSGSNNCYCLGNVNSKRYGVFLVQLIFLSIAINNSTT